ncbi:MAG: phosphomannomutase [Paracoccaceae bacterium]|nr:phosphomannomutase [Paracoccaceae bacterium]
MPARFGTSGLRGLARELTDAVVADHVRGFVAACSTGGGLHLGRDLRASSPRIALAVARAAREAGLAVTDCGAVPTPALALAARTAGEAAVMVTGSHIPADRNGLKFFTPSGEITKADEAAILARLGGPWRDLGGPEPRRDTQASAVYVARYLAAYGPGALSGFCIGVYAHSAVGRDLLARALAGLGADVREFGRSKRFVALDTEAVGARTRARLAAWSAPGGLDAIVSTDGDGDRPLLADTEGRIVPGDILGQITAAALGADSVVTPVSSNSGVDLSGRFARVIRTRIGSPFVIAGMEAAAGRVVGYEANGGFLLGFDAEGPAGPLPRLMTRDAFLPLIATLVAARTAGGVAALVAAEPVRFTATGRLPETPVELSAALMRRLAGDRAARAALLARLGGREARLDKTDGLRIRLCDGRILHLRPSGNAPEFRVYAEADSREAADEALADGLAAVAAKLGAGA